MAEPGESRDHESQHVPYTPINGHSWRCNCPVCDDFWAGPEGRAIYGLIMHWLKDHPGAPLYVVIPDDPSALETCSGPHFCPAPRGTVPNCRESCTACSGDRARPCFAPHPAQ